MNRLRTVVMLARYPSAGAVKTRLIPRLGTDGACQIHRLLVEHTASTVRRWRSTADRFELRVDYGDLPSHAIDSRWLARLEADGVTAQNEGDLGDRLHAAFADAQSPTVVIGSDCLELEPRHLDQAFEILESQNTAAIGPALDGGYTLIGLPAVASADLEAIFQNMPWGTERVLDEQLRRLQRAGLTTRELETLSDIDFAKDLERLNARGSLPVSFQQVLRESMRP